MSETILVTGASAGFGQAMCRRLVADGYRVIGSARRIDKLQALQEELGEAFYPLQMDVTDLSQVDHALASLPKTWERVDVLVNNAGITNDKLMLKMTEEDFERVLKINLTGAFNMTQAVLKPMSKARQGAIINMSSVVGLMGNIGQANYAASKAGLIGFTKSVAREVAARGVRVNAIAPGFIESDMTDAIPEKMKDAMIAQVPMKRIGQAEEVAEVAAFLASQEYLTGQTIAIDGGMTMQ